MTIKATLSAIKNMLNSQEPERAQQHEAMPAAVEEFNLNNYFSVCASHGTNNLELQANGFYTFFDCKKTVKIIDTITVDCGNPSLSDVNPSVFDYLPDIYSDDTAEETAYRIVTTVNDEEILIGHFLIELKTLLLTDLTHSDRNHGGEIPFNLIGLILEELKERECIVPLNNAVEDRDELGFNFDGLTFGCDPELEYVSNGRIVSASCGLENVASRTGGSDKIGLDGCGHPIELRPSAFNRPENVVAELKSLFTKIKMHHFTTVGNTYAIGGHLHVGFGLSSPINPTSDLLKLLDYFIGAPAMLLNGTARGSYAQLSSYRTKSYGFEYRTPSAAIFTNPKITLITFRVLKNIITNYMKCKEFKISNSVSEKELIDYVGLSEDDAKYYINFFKVFKSCISESDNVVDFWVNGKSELMDADDLDLESLPEEPNIFSIVFTDHWEEMPRSMIREAILDLEDELESPVSIHLFGWAENRGRVVSGIQVDGYETISNMPHNSDLTFGLPYSTRADGVDISVFVNHIVDAVRDYIE